MDKEHILKEIRRTTKENGGIPLGKLRFLNETGIKENDWRGRYWVRWGDAVKEAGFAPNSLQVPYDEKALLEKYILLAREIGHLPVPAEITMKTRKDPDFPHETTYRTRFGPKSALVKKLVQYCQSHAGHDDIITLCNGYKPNRTEETDELQSVQKVGYVYLIKHGSRREYKIGKTFNPVRREGEIILQLPEKVQPIHYIKTDDPSGIEAYWHSRFSAKRKEGEWFELTSTDVQAFKKWKRII